MGKRRRAGTLAPRKQRPRRLGTILFVVGIVAVLGGTFAAGALAGRFSLRPTAVANAKSVDRPPKPAPAPPPALTFYRELTAPLTPPPLPPKPPAKPAAKRETPPAPESARRADATDAPSRPAPESAPPRGDAGRYTVQVGSYNMRAQAEAMRARLAIAGHEAYITQGEAAGVTRYRVRIGAFPTAEDARQAAVRLASQAHVATYVTTR